MLSWPFGKRSKKVVLTISGAAMIVGGAWFGAATARFLAESDRASGTVVSVVGQRSAKGTTLYHAVARYTPRGAARSVTFKDRAGLWPSPFSIGDAVTVAYRPGAPSAARIVSFWTIWLLPALTVFVGLFVALVSTFLPV